MDLLEQFKTYVSEIQEIDLYFKRIYKVDSVLSAVRNKRIPKEGKIDDGEYYFHGIGCRVIFPKKVINYDYSPKDIAGGVSIYDLINYLKSMGKDFGEEGVETELNILVTRGELIYPKLAPNKSLYYLKSFNEHIALQMNEE